MHFAHGSIDMFGLQAEYHNICVNNHTLGNIKKILYIWKMLHKGMW